MRSLWSTEYNSRKLLPFECSASGRMLDEVLLLRRRPIDSSVFHGEAKARIPGRDPGWRWGVVGLLGPCPHLPPLALQPAHTLLTPLSTHRSGSASCSLFKPHERKRKKEVVGL